MPVRDYSARLSVNDRPNQPRAGENSKPYRHNALDPNYGLVTPMTDTRYFPKDQTPDRHSQNSEEESTSDLSSQLMSENFARGIVMRAAKHHNS